MCICIWVPLRLEEDVRVPRAGDGSVWVHQMELGTKLPFFDKTARTLYGWMISPDSHPFLFKNVFFSKMVIKYNTKQTSLWEMGRIDNNPIYGAIEPLLWLSIHKDMSVRLVNDTFILCQMCGPKHHHTVVRTFANRFQPLPVLDLLTKQQLHSYESLNDFYLFLPPPPLCLFCIAQK